MSQKKNVLLLCGGGSSEHEVSLRSADYFSDLLSQIDNVETYRVEIKKNGDRVLQDGSKVTLTKDGILLNYKDHSETKLNYCIPCIHGAPGETGQIQALLEMMELPFYGPSFEASILCFNKVSTKLWLKECSIPVTPFEMISDQTSESIKKAKDFFNKNSSDIFIKSTHQGSSVGCYHVSNEDEVEKKIKEAFKLSPYVLLEKTIHGRELEVATFNIDENIIATNPGEIICPNSFYTYEQKYDKESPTQTKVNAEISTEVSEKVKAYSIQAFKVLKLKDLSRIDFFLTPDDEIYLNEINTFPGHTKISMFPMIMEAQGQSYLEYLKNKIEKYSRNS
tara:strand:+ start:16303 stop:17310 length:1008 start_codon:yes stop_codon:yes gene_type:complete